MKDLSLIKKLRETTGCGIGDCSKAINENNGDFEKAIDWLRKKGLSSAAKKNGRVAAEGLVAINTTDNCGYIIEINSETDFVSKNSDFQNLVLNIIKNASDNKVNDIENLQNLTLKDGKKTSEEIAEKVGIIGENIVLRRFSRIETSKGVVAGYVHNAISSNMGKIGVLVALETNANDNLSMELGKKIAMHIAAAKPEFLSIEAVNKDKLNREIEILKEQSKTSGKPDSIIEKMVEGRIRKFYEEVVLLEQFFVMDDTMKIKDLLTQFKKDNNEDIKIKAFEMFILGDGIEKKENNFAEEVASMTKI
jgi:elongation factor Ts